jgi:transposase-like protein
MKRKRRHLAAEFKARVAAEALKGEKTIQQIAQENDIAPTQVSTWKKDLEDHMPSHLERKIGQLLIEKEFLEKKDDQLGFDLSERP